MRGQNAWRCEEPSGVLFVKGRRTMHPDERWLHEHGCGKVDCFEIDPLPEEAITLQGTVCHRFGLFVWLDEEDRQKSKRMRQRQEPIPSSPEPPPPEILEALKQAREKRDWVRQRKPIEDQPDWWIELWWQ
jgi:hypothetical protein